MENGDDRRAGQSDVLAVSEIVGCKDSIDALLRQLKVFPYDSDSDSEEKDEIDYDALRVISVVDKDTMGKTALVRSVYGRPEVKRRFDCRAWFHAEGNYSVEEVLVSILKQVSTSELKDIDQADLEKLSYTLRRYYFFEQRYLVVLDNIKEVSPTVNLLTHFIDARNGSRVIITTRNDKLSHHIDPWIDSIKFQPLTEEENGKLLLLPLQDQQVHPNAHSNLMPSILSWSSLSPAGTWLLGGLLSVKQDSKEWFNEISDSLEKKGDPSLEKILSLCYDNLTPELQRCIMYVCQFPREYEIPARRLLRLWVADSLVLAPGSVSQDAENCFMKLVRRNMIHVASHGKRGMFAKTCCMPGFIYDFLLKKASETGFFHILGNDSSANTSNGEPIVPKRLVMDNARIVNRQEGSSETQGQSFTMQDVVKQVRSLISFNTKKIRMPRTEKVIFLNHPNEEESSLEVLDLEGVYKPVLPTNLGYVLLNLKYLGLRWTILRNLPESVGSLPRLETLDVKHTNIMEVPSSIWTIKSLRHLYLNETSFNKSKRRRWRLLPNGKLPNRLQTLCGLQIEGKSPMFDALRKLTALTKLSLSCPSALVTVIIDHLSSLTALQSLKLKSKDILGQPSTLNLKGMSKLTSLSNLYLFGRIEKKDLEGISFQPFPTKLKSLTLSMSLLDDIPMDKLSELEHLTDLRLYGHSYVGQTLSLSHQMFPELRTLKMWKLDQLESLTVEGEAGLRLEELDIRDCQKLKKIDILGNRNALKEVSLAKVEGELAKSLEKSLGHTVIIILQN